jgi:predicted PurR-regulated permease PerM
MKNIFHGVFLTQFIVSIILGALTIIGFYLIGLITSPIPLVPLWAFFVVLASLLPLVANFMFYAPLGLYYIFFTPYIFKGSLILLFGVTVLQIFPEIMLRPYVGSKRLDEHPLIVFLGFLAGPLVLGFKGLILGPVLLILTKEFAINYSNLVSEDLSENHNENKED